LNEEVFKFFSNYIKFWHDGIVCTDCKNTWLVITDFMNGTKKSSTFRWEDTIHANEHYFDEHKWTGIRFLLSI